MTADSNPLTTDGGVVVAPRVGVGEADVSLAVGVALGGNGLGVGAGVGVGDNDTEGSDFGDEPGNATGRPCWTLAAIA